MTKMFWSLLKTRISLLFLSGKRTNRSISLTPKKVLGKVPKMILIAVLVIYCLAVFFGMFGALFYSLGIVFGGTELEWFYFALAGMLSLVLSFVGSVFATQTQIYDAKDNELLLSMPIPVKFILASRMAALLVMNLMYESLVMLPAIVVWGILGNYTLGSAIGILTLFLIIPFLSMSLSCIVGWLIALLTSKIKRKNLITTALSMIALVAYMAIYSFAMNYVEVLISNGEQIATAVKNGFYPAYALGLAGNGNYLMMLACVSVVAFIFFTVYRILDKTFIKISTAKTGAPKIKYKGGRMKESGATVALVKKEFAHFISSPAYIMNGALGVVFSVIVAVLAAVKGKELFVVFIDRGFPTELIELFVVMISLSLVSLNIISAPSISIEAKTLWLIRSLPLDPSKILIAKAWNHFLVSETGALIVGVSAAIFLPVSITAKIFVIIMPTLFNAFCALFGVYMNLLLPKFNWINETVAIKQGMSTMVCMFGSMGVVALYLLPYLLWLVQYVSAAVYTLIFAILLVVVSFIIYSYLTGKGRYRFERLGQ